jgi:hypothetical protein
MTPLQNALRILVFMLILFLIFLIFWLFRCNCRRGAIEPGSVGQQIHYALVAPHRAEAGKYRTA